MSGGIDAGTAFLNVEAKLDKMQSTLEGEGLGIFEKFGGDAGKAIAAAIATAVAAGGVLYKVGSMFDDAFDKIRVSTGKTGADLGGLEQNFRDVLKYVPASFGDASTAISVFNQQLGLTGRPLEGVAGLALQLSHITGTDLSGNVKALAGLFNNFGIAADDQRTKMNELFRVYQATGASVSDLATAMTQGGTQMRTLGLSFEQGASLVGLLAKNGLDAGSVFAGLTHGIASAAKGGESASDTFRRVVKDIQTLKDPTKATSEAMELFGARAGPRLASLIREGKLSYDDLAQSIAAGGDTIQKASFDTADFSEKWQVFKNKVLLALEPVATRVFGYFGTEMDKLGPKAEKALGQVRDWFERNKQTISDWGNRAKDLVGDVIDAIGWLAPRIINGLRSAEEWFHRNEGTFRSWGKTAVRIVSDIIQWAKDFGRIVGDAFGAVERFIERNQGTWRRWWNDIAGVLGDIKDIFQKAFSAIPAIVEPVVSFISDMWDRFGHTLINRIRDAWDAVSQIMSGAFEALKGLFDVFAGVFTGKWSKAWNGIKESFGGVWNAIVGVLKLAWDGVRGTVEGGLALLSEGWSKTWGGMRDVFSSIWNGIEGIGRGAINRVIDVINGFIRALDSISIDIPSLFGVGGGHIGFNVSQISHLHTGGIVGPQPARAGLANDEMMAVLQTGEGVVSRSQMATLIDAVGKMAKGGGRSPAMHVENLNVRDNTDAELIARRLEFATVSGEA